MDPPRPDGSACEWHSRGHGFDPHQLHQLRQSLSDERRRPAHLRAAFCVAFVSLPAERSRNPAGQLRPLKRGSASVAVHGSSIRRRTSLGGARLARSRRRSVSRDVRTIRNSLHSIARALTHLIPVLEAAVSNASTPSRAGRKLRLSAARRTALTLQGRYMGHLRTLRPRAKARVKALRATKGIHPAIALAKRLAKA